jgi:septal ring factor EnvC (AmiA/AmiB activator)
MSPRGQGPRAGTGRWTMSESRNAKAVSAGESFIREKTMPTISQIKSDIYDVGREIADTEEKLSQLKANKKNLESNLELVPRAWSCVQKSIDALKIPREEWEGLSDEEYEEQQAEHRLLIAVYTGSNTLD